MSALRYLGGGFLPGVPARDLTADEVRRHGGESKLRASGLYGPVPAEHKSKKGGGQEDKLAGPPDEDKEG